MSQLSSLHGSSLFFGRNEFNYDDGDSHKCNVVYVVSNRGCKWSFCRVGPRING